MAAPSFATVPDALAALRAGRSLVLCGEDGGRPVVAFAATAADAGAVNFMAREARGLVCLALTPERCAELGLELIPPRRGPGGEAEAFTVSIEAREGVTTGISAGDRARTIAVAVDPAAGEADVCSPGHVFPIRVDAAGVLGRPAVAEAAVDLARAAGLAPAAALCAVLGDHGDVLEPEETAAWCDAHGLLALPTAAVIEWRRGREWLLFDNHPGDDSVGLSRHGLSLVDEISVEAGRDPREESFVRV